MTDTPKGCTCIWTCHDKGGSVFISMGKDCPAYPHERTYRVTTK